MNWNILSRNKFQTHSIKNFIWVSHNKLSSTNSLVATNLVAGVQTITMCNPKKRNVLSAEMMEALTTNIVANENNPKLRVIIIASEGPVFSSGHDLKELAIDKNDNIAKRVFHLASNLMLSIIRSPVPVIARVDGLAAAAGCQLVAQCDIAFCTEESTFSTPGAQFGIFCSTPGISIARCVPKMTALHMLLTGLPLTSSQALSSGLITKVCQKDNLDDEIKITCDAIESKSRAVIHAGKKFYYKQMQMDLLTAYQMGEEEMVRNLKTDDGQEGVRSFAEKRKAQWRHT